MKIYTKINFHKHTYCEFEMIDDEFFNNTSIHYKSKSGSLYFFSNEGVYRYSNHWGRVGDCRWKINGVKTYKNQNFYSGFAKWLDFYSLNSVEKNFYLKVNFEEESVNILSIAKLKNQDVYLMSLDFGLKRRKEISKLFKEYKWALHFNKNIDVIRKELITLLINTDKPLQELKRSLVSKF